jgi:hypothetical protein
MAEQLKESAQKLGEAVTAAKDSVVGAVGATGQRATESVRAPTQHLAPLSHSGYHHSASSMADSRRLQHSR